MRRSILTADIDAASEHICWIAKHQSDGFIPITVMEFSPGGRSAVIERRWFNNRDRELAVKVQRSLRKWKGVAITILYSVSSYSQRKAKSEFANPSRLVHVDFDLPTLPSEVPSPSRIVASSEKGKHLFWTLSEFLPPDRIQEINKALTYEFGGDKGGHAPAKQFRSVGFPNLKHDPPSLVKVEADSGLVHQPSTLLKSCKWRARETETSFEIDSDVVRQAKSVDAATVRRRLWHRLDPYARHRLRQTSVISSFSFRFDGRSYTYAGDDRSEIIWGLALAMRAAGARPEEVLATVMASVFWVARERDGKAEDSERLIRRVYEADLDTERSASSPAEEDFLALDPSIWAGLPVPKRKWLIEEWIPRSKVTLLYGDGGTGKTLLAMMLAVACAVGKRFLGLEIHGDRGYAFLAENDEDDTRIALDAICQHYGVGLGDLRGKLRIGSRAGFDNVLMSFVEGTGKHTRLFDRLLREVAGFAPQVVIIETAADLFGGNENARGEVRKFVADCCGRIALETNAAVILCAHPSAAGLKTGEGSSGSTAWNNSARSRLYLRREIDDNGHEADPNFRVFERRKANFAKAGEQLHLVWSDGVFAVDDPLRGRHGRRENEIKLIAEIRSAFEKGAPWSAHHQAGSRFIIPWMRTNLKLRHAAATEILHRLIRNGEIAEVEYDKHMHRRGLAAHDQAAKQQRSKEAK